VLFEFPTIEGLVPAVVEARELTRKGKATKYSSLVVPFQTGGSNPPCFLHGVSFELSRYLGLDQPSYGLVPYGHDGRQAPNTVEEMAANYLNEIRAVQPKGPYFIGGYSFGGIVAFEMAQQLHRQGQSVGLLVLLDPTPPSGIDSIVATVPQSPSSKSKDYLDEFVHHLQNLKQLSLTQQARYILDRLKWRGDQIRKGIKMMVCKLHHYTGFRVPPGLRMFYFTEVSQMATRRYIPKPYPGRLVLLKSQDGVDNSQAIWNRLTCGGVEFHQLPGKHFDPIRGLFVKDWGKQLKNCLLKAQGRMSRPVPRLSQSRSA
jgi:thioesterase domain-containing protein